MRTYAQVAIILGFAILLSLVSHLVSPIGFFAAPEAVGAVVRANAATFLPKLGLDEARRLSRDGAVLIDARMPDDYAAGHVDGAVSLPISADEAAWQRVVASVPRDARIVVYCQSETCTYADTVAARLLEQGFGRVMLYRGGWAEWADRSEQETGS